MCGIIGYIGHRRAYNVLVQGLHRLEYRGYDSAGIALVEDDGKLDVYKSKGKVADLEAKRSQTAICRETSVLPIPVGPRTANPTM